MSAMPLDDARGRLSELAAEVKRTDDRIVLTDHGEDVVALISAEELHWFERMEDAADLEAAREVLDSDEPSIPHEVVMRKIFGDEWTPHD